VVSRISEVCIYSHCVLSISSYRATDKLVGKLQSYSDTILRVQNRWQEEKNLVS